MRKLRLGCVAMALAFVVGDDSLRGDADKEVKSDRVARLINELIRELGHNRFTRREAASKELGALGPAALDALRKAAASTQDHEIKRRVGALIEAIAEARQKERNMLLEKSFINGTKWRVAVFVQGWPEAPDPTPWTFHADGTVQAGALWKGYWQPDGENAVHVSINNGTDEFRVVFLSRRKFVAIKGDEMYRVGSAP